jgi:hypothetical protein
MMYQVTLPNNKPMITDLEMAFALGHESDLSRTEILTHEDYVLTLKGTLEITLTNGEVLTGDSAYSRVGHDTIEQGMDTAAESDNFRITESPWFEWEDEDQMTLQILDSISRNPAVERQRLDEILEEVYG